MNHILITVRRCYLDSVYCRTGLTPRRISGLGLRAYARQVGNYNLTGDFYLTDWWKVNISLASDEGPKPATHFDGEVEGSVAPSAGQCLCTVYLQACLVCPDCRNELSKPCEETGSIFWCFLML